MDNGKKVIGLVKVELIDGNMVVSFGGGLNTALISHALRIASLELDNQIIAAQQKPQSSIEVAPPNFKPIVGQDIVDRIRRRI